MKTRYPLLMVFLLLSSLLFAQEQKEKKINNFEEENPIQLELEKTTQIIGANAANNVVTYDFTTSASKYYGGAAGAAILEISVAGDTTWGMVAGDTDVSGVVDAADRSNTWNDRNLAGYKASDVDLSGVTDAADRSITWNNRNKTAQVP